MARIALGTAATTPSSRTADIRVEKMRARQWARSSNCFMHQPSCTGENVSLSAMEFLWMQDYTRN